MNKKQITFSTCMLVPNKIGISRTILISYVAAENDVVNLFVAIESSCWSRPLSIMDTTFATPPNFEFPQCEKYHTISILVDAHL